ncbi:MAG: radical SAM family heme chaperone HemW [Actinomycetota bacterium]|nr:radical SAM family heme chaperone HemW [Actinomycetota bacterium]
MPSTLPEGEAVPVDGSLPVSAADGMADRTLSMYVHVPFCATRCGYCDFNTYTLPELTSGGSASSPESWLDAALAEIRLAGHTLRAIGDDRTVSTVFVGGGTPSLVGAGPLVTLVDSIRNEFGLTHDAELTTEANPESTDHEFLAGIAAGGFTRLSLGMQSVAPQVLVTLDRTHTPGRPAEVVRWAREAGLQHINLDLIYGTPGESDADFQASLAASIAVGVDHVSAYSLIVEPGTRMARQVAAGSLPMTDDDVLADRYLLAEEALSAAGFHWYEVSNWATSIAARCRHNLAYWRGGDWWGIGPGAHSHVGGVRWWNVKHPAAYADRLTKGGTPAHSRERLTTEARQIENVLLRLRLSEGLPLRTLDAAGRRQASLEAADGLLDPAALAAGRLQLTLTGRLLADGLALRLLP